MTVDRAAALLRRMSEQYIHRAAAKRLQRRSLEEIALDYWLSSLLFPMERGLRAELEGKQ